MLFEDLSFLDEEDDEEGEAEDGVEGDLTGNEANQGKGPKPLTEKELAEESGPTPISEEVLVLPSVEVALVQ